jgi:DNA-binding CsgD family transcriptional regulator
MDEVVASIYRAAAGTEAWSHVLSTLTQHLDVMGCQMIGVSASTGAVLFSHADDGIPSEAELDYVRVYHGVDPRVPLLLSAPSGQWLYDEDVFDEQVTITNAYYRDLLIPYGGRYTASTKLVEADGEIVLIGFLSRLGAEAFTGLRRQALETLSFHLREAATIYQKTRKLMTASFAGAELLDRMSRPAFLMSVGRTVSLMNAAARRNLARADVLSLRRDRLVALSEEGERQLSIAFEELLLRIASGDTAQRRIVRLPGRQGTAASAASLTAFVPKETMHAFGKLPQILMLVHERTHRSTPDVLLWEAAYALTPGQSRVALAIYRGNTMREAATQLQIAESTVRTHLNEVYAKTGTTRQAQLVLALSALQA